MSDEQEIEVGQVWRSLNGKRTVRVAQYEQGWDDCRVRNLLTGRKFAIFGCYLRSRYELVDAAEVEALRGEPK